MSLHGFADCLIMLKVRIKEKSGTHPLTDGHSFFRHWFGIRDVVLHDRLEQLVLILTVERGLLWNRDRDFFSQMVKGHICKVGSPPGRRCWWIKDLSCLTEKCAWNQFCWLHCNFVGQLGYIRGPFCFSVFHETFSGSIFYPRHEQYTVLCI